MCPLSSNRLITSLNQTSSIALCPSFVPYIVMSYQTICRRLMPSFGKWHSTQTSTACERLTALGRNASTLASPVQSPSRPRRPRDVPAALTVTPAAETRIIQLLSQRNPRPAGVRVGLRTRGCNGMAYVLNYAEQPSKFDEKVNINGAHVYIDPRALMHIVGTTMDFVDNDLVSEFVFHNPNAKGTCGCGESFNV